MQSPAPRKINEIANLLGLDGDDVEPIGWFKGKFALGLENSLTSNPVGRYLDVTAISPTPLGEGKTVVTIGLAMALSRLGHRSIATLREPSLAPVFGMKGGGAGGGRATLLPAEEINLHFTGDSYAVSSATNLLAAVIDNHLQRGQDPRLDPASISWRRVIDMNDKGLSSIITGLGHTRQAPLRETGFELTAASEVMAILSLASGLDDLRQRIGRIFVGTTFDGEPVFAETLRCAGAMTALLRDAIRPNLVQTCEHTPALVHTGPFGNIAHGNSSIIADQIALRLADYVVTESGFGADCGAEKFFNLKCLTSGLVPNVEVLVCTVRALKLHSGKYRVHPGKPLPPELLQEDLASMREGSVNLRAHLDILRQFGVPVVVAINRFPSDTVRELEEIRRIAIEFEADGVAVCNAFEEGSAGAIELAEAVIDVSSRPNEFHLLYPGAMCPEQKLQTVATRIYGADGIDLLPNARRQLESYCRM
ncbi:MAG TPA: formate--tetrahydrofolate ligase, partial [Planctomycetaceae bacterium]|nr:formate--tetrahydrofolate ligase [Planctomycetaceae bacterium]